MLDSRMLTAVVSAYILLIPAWITQVAGTSLNLSPKRWLIGSMVMISAIAIVTTITTPNSNWLLRIGITLIPTVVFVISIITAYRVWPKQASRS